LLQSQVMHPILRLTYFGGLNGLRLAIVNVYFFDVLVVLKMLMVDHQVTNIFHYLEIP